MKKIKYKENSKSYSSNVQQRVVLNTSTVLVKKTFICTKVSQQFDVKFLLPIKEIFKALQVGITLLTNLDNISRIFRASWRVFINIPSPCIPECSTHFPHISKINMSFTESYRIMSEFVPRLVFLHHRPAITNCFFVVFFVRMKVESPVHIGDLSGVKPT